MKPTLLLVPEERVGHPDLLGVRHGEVLDLGCNEQGVVM